MYSWEPSSGSPNKCELCLSCTPRNEFRKDATCILSIVLLKQYNIMGQSAATDMRAFLLWLTQEIWTLLLFAQQEMSLEKMPLINSKISSMYEKMPYLEQCGRFIELLYCSTYDGTEWNLCTGEPASLKQWFRRVAGNACFTSWCSGVKHLFLRLKTKWKSHEIFRWS